MQIVSANAPEIAAGHGGWFVGHFMQGALQSRDVEIKWGVHPAGQSRHDWSSNEATTLSVLVRGRFRVRFEGREVLLEREGDFVLWQPGVLHGWEAEQDSLIFTVRWPSVPPR